MPCTPVSDRGDRLAGPLACALGVGLVLGFTRGLALRPRLSLGLARRFLCLRRLALGRLALGFRLGLDLVDQLAVAPLRERRARPLHDDSAADVAAS